MNALSDPKKIKKNLINVSHARDRYRLPPEIVLESPRPKVINNTKRSRKQIYSKKRHTHNIQRINFHDLRQVIVLSHP